MSQYEKEVLIHLKAILEKIDNFGNSVSIAFKQIKQVMQHLGETIQETREDLSEYSGVIIDHPEWYQH